MLAVGALSMLASITIYAVIWNFSSLGPWMAFLISWVAVFLAGIALNLKEALVRKGISPLGKWIATFCAALPLVVGFDSFLTLWHHVSGFWLTALLVWFALLSVMSVWVPSLAAEEGS